MRISIAFEDHTRVRARVVATPHWLGRLFGDRVVAGIIRRHSVQGIVVTWRWENTHREVPDDVLAALELSEPDEHGSTEFPLQIEEPEIWRVPALAKGAGT